MTATFSSIKYFLMVLVLLSNSVFAGYIDKDLEEGDIRIHIPDNPSESCSAVLLGVGTAMGANGYDKLSQAINQHGHIAII